MKRWQLILIAAIAVLAAALLAAWHLSRNSVHEAIPGEVYRSAQLSTGKLEDVVAEHGIRTVISLRRPRPGKRWYKNELAATKDLGIAHHDIALDATFSPRIDHLLQLRDLLQHAPRPILVKSRSGADRTGLAAMMATLLDGRSSLEEARARIDGKYDAFRDAHMGQPILEEYSAWLDAGGQRHSSERFNHWLENEYLDLSGNVHFLIDPIRGQLWQRPWGLIEEGFEFEVRRDEGPILELSGWAFDTRNASLLRGLELRLGGVMFQETWYGIHLPWLIDDFGKQAYLDSGWSASHPLEAFEDGCHELLLTFTRTDGSSWTSPPAARICIN